ncbi:MAG: aromatic amino acid lyase, partial [Candidatus Limnocylindrales bacterium]
VAARQARDVVRNASSVVALELLCAAQGLDFRCAGGLTPGVGVVAAHRLVREQVAHLETDRDPQPDIAAAQGLVSAGSVAALVFRDA